MKLRLFYEDVKGYVDTIDNVKKVSIKKEEKVNRLIIMLNDGREIGEHIRNVRLAYLIDIDTMQELFRYEK